MVDEYPGFGWAPYSAMLRRGPLELEGAPMEQPLSDLKILDFTHAIAGPYCTKLLADLGAEVVKIERPGIGDPARAMAPFLHDDPHPEKSGLFLHLNTNKRGVTLDLKTTSGQSLARTLAQEVDAVVESFRPGVMASLGLDYEALGRDNPRLVYASISNFGQTGPYRDYKATEIVIAAMGWEMYSCGQPDREPLKPGATVLQFQGGLIAAVATMGALTYARRTGQGQYVDVSLMETQAGTIDRRYQSLLRYQYSGEYTKRAVPGGMSIMPSGPYPCADGFVRFLTLPQWWPRLCEMLGQPQLASDPRFANRYNVEMKGEVDALVMAWCMERGKVKCATEAQSHGIPCLPVNTAEDLLKDPQIQERGFFVEVEHPVMGKTKLPGAPYKLKQSPWALRRPAPTLGQHNAEVLGALGYGPDDLVRLRGLGVI
ncbi:MAG: CoA transferase [Chloroflexi bacterium]|nr:CoA transferase [Chloroflexota bacterium]